MPKRFENWPLLDAEINSMLGRKGRWFVRIFVVLFASVFYFTTRPWQVLNDPGLEMLAWLAIVGIPLGAWLIGGMISEYLYMSLEALYWLSTKRIRVKRKVAVWSGTGGLMLIGGIIGSFIFVPFYYSYIVALAGLIIVGRMLVLIWGCTVNSLPEPSIFHESTMEGFRQIQNEIHNKTRDQISGTRGASD
jgi:hypothetical protein